MSLRHRIGALVVDVDFRITQPWTVLFGPSGSGKTTILRAIAGLLHPDLGKIRSTVHSGTECERTFTLLDTSADVFVAPHRRVVRLAQQRAALFPHLTVLENLQYGMAPSSRIQDDEFTETASSLLSGFQIARLIHKYPSELSGGEAQRVHLARTVAATDCRLLLLDEPFAGLDAPLRDSMIATLQAWQKEHQTPILSVTHDVAEAFQLGAEVVKLADGRTADQGPVERTLAEERARLLAQLNS